MLVVKGTRVRLVLDSGRTVSCSGGMMHDPAGKHWPRCSVLIGGYSKGSEPVSDLGARQYFGAGYVAKQGTVDTPPKSLADGWRELGVVQRIYYVRVGNIYGGQLFKHDFRRTVTAYRRGRFVRLELGTFCNLGPRGFVSP